MTTTKTTKTETTFERLSEINVNSKVEKKNNLTYLSWAWAWSEVKKACPDATYVMGDTDYDEALGFMCHTSVTIDGETLPMWLPVMDGANKSMKKSAYTYTTKYGEKNVDAATTFDINKTMMRCLVKNLAMFGLGLYIYAGEDLPENEVSAPPIVKAPAFTALEKGDDNWKRVTEYIKANKAQGRDSIQAALKTKYTMTADVIAALDKLIAAK